MRMAYISAVKTLGPSFNWYFFLTPTVGMTKAQPTAPPSLTESSEKTFRCVEDSLLTFSFASEASSRVSTHFLRPGSKVGR